VPVIIILVSLLFVGMLAIGFAFDQFKSPLQILFETLGMLLVFAGCGACVFMIFLL
jgi:hypothetical protein